MRKFFAMLLLAAMVFTLAACGPDPAVSEVEMDGKTFRVDTDLGKIFEGDNFYDFRISTSNGYAYRFEEGTLPTEITLVYPNGGRYIWTIEATDGSFLPGSGSWRGAHGSEEHAEPDTLIAVLSRADLGDLKLKEPVFGGSGSRLIFFIPGIIFIILGIVNLFNPMALWKLRYSWWFKNLEPTDAALTLSRIGGGFAIVLGFILMVFGLGLAAQA